MYCCSNCFSDRFLRDYFEIESDVVGRCSFCNSDNTEVLDPEDLTDVFQLLIDLYEPSDSVDAVFLHEQIQKDWYLFSELIDDGKRSQLLDKICVGSIAIGKKYVPKIPQIVDRIKQWEEFREELKHTNRYFPKKIPALETENIGILLDSLILLKEEIPQDVHRARINKKGGTYTLAEMGRPPVEKTLNGRANPLGISYLYAASDVSTAISEVQPYKGEVVTVAKIRITGTKTFADLRNPKQTASPFELEEKALKFLYSEMPLLITLGEELSKPIIPKEAALEYLPSQYLCELIKSRSFSGVIYNSSLSKGYNIALFDDTGLEFLELKKYEVVDNNIRYEELT
jgi:hypothetical protein